MSVSIKDVALKAGVSIASVSRVLSGKPGVGAQTAERIKQVIDELGYRLNLGARGLVKENWEYRCSGSSRFIYFE
ncbi:hypothetical protein BSAF29S_03426 [Bacillus safensis subsp. safensis]